MPGQGGANPHVDFFEPLAINPFEHSTSQDLLIILALFSILIFSINTLVSIVVAFFTLAKERKFWKVFIQLSYVFEALLLPSFIINCYIFLRAAYYQPPPLGLFDEALHFMLGGSSKRDHNMLVAEAITYCGLALCSVMFVWLFWKYYRMKKTA